MRTSSPGADVPRSEAGPEPHRRKCGAKPYESMKAPTRRGARASSVVRILYVAGLNEADAPTSSCETRTSLTAFEPTGSSA